MNDHVDRAVGALVGLAVGDALGSTLEFSRRDSKPVVTDLIGGGPFGLRPGEWTDDTSMALCLADSLIAKGGLDGHDLLTRFVDWWRNGTNSVTGACFDIGITTRESLGSFEQSGVLTAGPEDRRQAGNGSLMRLAPVAIFCMGDAAQAEEMAAAQSETTHPAPVAHDACRLFARMLVEAIDGTAKGEVLSPREWTGTPEVGSIARGDWREKERAQIRSTGYSIDTLEAAIWCVARSESFEDAVILAANLGDDSDTVAAVTGQLAGAIWGLAGIPEHWVSKVAWAEEIIAKAEQLVHVGSLSAFVPDEEQPVLSAEIIAHLRKRNHRKSAMTKFGRSFDLEAAARCQDEWWTDLLRFWRPSGVEAGSHGLRLAVRDGYLNFYRKGQSIGRIEVARNGELTSSIHAKYVWPEQRATLGSEYLRLQGDTLFQKREPVAKYAGASTLMAWIETAETWSGAEKRAIDDVLDHTDNIIDLEMGQPGTALRMDMVAVERDDDGLWVAFWEAKRARDSRVRCHAELDEVSDVTAPHVLGQLRDYRTFIEGAGNRELVAAAYGRAAHVLCELRRLADASGPHYPLAPEIVAAANSSVLRVRPNARLLIFDDDPKDHAWRDKHAGKLAGADIDMHTSVTGQKLVWGKRA